jgi:hypothetical protein
MPSEHDVHCGFVALRNTFQKHLVGDTFLRRRRSVDGKNQFAVARAHEILPDHLLSPSVAGVENNDPAAVQLPQSD